MSWNFPIKAAADQLIGGLADDCPDCFDKKQLRDGIAVEREHTNNPAVAKEIAKDHIAEIPDYYSRLKKMEDQAKEEMSRKADLGTHFNEGNDGGLYQEVVDTDLTNRDKVVPTWDDKNPDGVSKGHQDQRDANETMLTDQVMDRKEMPKVDYRDPKKISENANGEFYDATNNPTAPKEGDLVGLQPSYSAVDRRFLENEFRRAINAGDYPGAAHWAQELGQDVKPVWEAEAKSYADKGDYFGAADISHSRGIFNKDYAEKAIKDMYAAGQDEKANGYVAAWGMDDQIILDHARMRREKRDGHSPHGSMTGSAAEVYMAISKPNQSWGFGRESLFDQFIGNVGEILTACRRHGASRAAAREAVIQVHSALFAKHEWMSPILDRFLDRSYGTTAKPKSALSTLEGCITDYVAVAHKNGWDKAKTVESSLMEFSSWIENYPDTQRMIEDKIDATYGVSQDVLKPFMGNNAANKYAVQFVKDFNHLPVPYGEFRRWCSVHQVPAQTLYALERIAVELHYVAMPEVLVIFADDQELYVSEDKTKTQALPKNPDTTKTPEEIKLADGTILKRMKE